MTDVPALIGRYEVQSLLGSGGMGVLYLARDPVIDRHVALKLLHVDSEDLRRRFVREARSAGRLQHPNIVTVYDVGDHEGQLYIAMEYIDGDTLATLIRDDVPFSTVRKLDIVDQVASGLGFAHHRGIVHRDIKPANLMITRGGLVKVLDFGIARLAHKQSGSLAGGTLIGTPAYMAPEQLEGAVVDVRSDIYAVGLVMYELLSGRRAFVGATTADVLQQVLTGQPTPLAQLTPDLDPDLFRVVARAMARLPEDRYQHLQDLRNDLARVRRRAEQVSGADEATVVVALPTRPASGAVPGSGAPAATTRPLPTAPGVEHGGPAAPDADEDAVLAHFALERARTTKAPPVSAPAATDQVSAPAATDQTVFAPVTPTTSSPASVPAVVVPPIPSQTGAAITHDSGPLPVPLPRAPAVAGSAGAAGGATEDASSRADPEVTPGSVPTAPLPGSRRGLPAVVILAAIAAVLFLCVIGAYVAVRASGMLGTPLLLGRLQGVFEAARERPTDTRAEAPAESPADAPAETPAEAAAEAPVEVPVDVPVEAAREAPADAVADAPTERPAQQPPRPPVGPAAPAVAAPPTPAADIPAAAVPPPRVAPPPSAPVVPPATREARDARDRVAPLPRAPVPAQPQQAARPDLATAPAAAAARDAPDDVPVPLLPLEDEAVGLVRAYVAARNASDDAGIRRVWPSVDDQHLRRISSAFSSPLTLGGCTVQPTDGTRAEARCQLTQSGSTAFASAEGLTIRRSFVFDLARQGRSWVIAGLRE